MNEFTPIETREVTPALLNRTAVEAMMAADALPCGGQVELIEGILIEMAPANDPHSDAHADLVGALIPRLKRDYRAKIDPATFFGDDTMTGPDLLVVPREISAREVEPRDICLLIEISASTLSYDLNTKARIYGAHGVPEYWVVDVQNRRVHVHRVSDVNGYGDVTVRAWSDPIQPLFDPDLTLVLDEIIELS